MTDERPVSKDEVRAAWDTNAPFWDARLSEPTSWQNTLIFPAVEQLLQVHPGERILEVACGNGLLAARMAEAGARVVAFDFSEEQLGYARQRADHSNVDLRVVDATDERQLLALGAPASFDAAVCNMALMDIVDLEPLAAALPILVKADGRFVFSVTHPCFNGTGSSRMVEAEDRGGELVTTRSVRVFRYIRPRQGPGIGITGQPAPQFYFDRPVSLLFGTFFQHGFVLDGLEEPVFGEDALEPGDPDYVWTDLPPVLVARMRLTGGWGRAPAA